MTETCLHCSGPVDVVFGGTSLRCGCGRTLFHGAVKPPPVVPEWEAVSERMRALGVKRLRTEKYEIELGDPPRAAAEAVSLPAEEPGDTCACGHSIAVEHSADGCLRACPIAACAPEKDDADA